MAAGRDRAQIAAHEAARRSELSALPNETLVARREGLKDAIANEVRVSEIHRDLGEKLDLARRRYESALDNRDAVEAMGWRERRREMPHAEERLENNREHLEAVEEMRRQAEAQSVEARREAAAIDAILAARRQLALTAARLAPADYIAKELGERPAEPEMRREWDRGVEAIERYRQEHGITDKEHAFGATEPKGHGQRAEREVAQERLRFTQRQLGLDQRHDLAQEIEAGMEIGM